MRCTAAILPYNWWNTGRSTRPFGGSMQMTKHAFPGKRRRKICWRATWRVRRKIGPCCNCSWICGGRLTKVAAQVKKFLAYVELNRKEGLVAEFSLRQLRERGGRWDQSLYNKARRLTKNAGESPSMYLRLHALEKENADRLAAENPRGKGFVLNLKEIGALHSRYFAL